MNIRSIDLNLLVTFDALFDEQNVSRAADRLALTQPAVSGMLKKLRIIFANELFVRTSHGIIPTPRAEALAIPVKELLVQAQTIVQPETFDPLDNETTIRMCGSDYLQLSVISPLITRLREIAPKMRVSVIPRPSSGIVDLLARGEIDINICAKEVAIPDLPARNLFSDRFICVVRRAHPLNKRTALRSLDEYDHILVDPTQGQFSGPMDEPLAKKGVRRRVAASVPTFSMLFDLLENNDYIAFIPSRLYRDRSDRLKVLEIDFKTPRIEFVANWHSRMNGDQRHKWLRDQIVKVTRRN